MLNKKLKMKNNTDQIISKSLILSLGIILLGVIVYIAVATVLYFALGEKVFLIITAVVFPFWVTLIHPIVVKKVRQFMFYLSSENFKEYFFLKFVVHCMCCDYQNYISQIFKTHNTNFNELVLALKFDLDNPSNLGLDKTLPEWLDISHFCYTNFRTIENTSVHQVESNFIGIMPKFKAFMDKQNIPLILENYRFHLFIKNNQA